MMHYCIKVLVINNYQIIFILKNKLTSLCVDFRNGFIDKIIHVALKEYLAD